jgi:hypothetical protein
MVTIERYRRNGYRVALEFGDLSNSSVNRLVKFFTSNKISLAYNQFCETSDRVADNSTYGVYTIVIRRNDFMSSRTVPKWRAHFLGRLGSLAATYLQYRHPLIRQAQEGLDSPVSS